MTFIFPPPSSSMAPMGNGTAEHHNVGTILDLGHPLFQAKAVPIIRTTQGYCHLLMLRLRHSPTISCHTMPTLLTCHLFLSFHHSSSQSTSLTQSVMLKSCCLRWQEAIHLSCGSGAICIPSLMVKMTKNG